MKEASTCISVIPQLCREGPGDLGHGLAPGHHLVMKDCRAVSSNADSCHRRARTSSLVPSAVGAGWAGTGAAQVLGVSHMFTGGWGCWLVSCWLVSCLALAWQWQPPGGVEVQSEAAQGSSADGTGLCFP